MAILGRFGQVWACLDKFGQVWTRQQISKMGEKAEKIRKKNSYRIRIKSRCVMALVINGHSENLLLVSEGRNKKLYSCS